MTRISKGTVSVANGGTMVTLWAGDDPEVTLSEFTSPAGSHVIIEGVSNYIKERLSTVSFELEEAHTGAGGAGLRCMISALTAAERSTGTLNARVATTIEQLRVLDANGRGLFYNLIGVTGANDPGPGNLAFDNADPQLVTALYFDVLDANEGGRDVSGIVDLWPVGSVLVVRSIASNAYAAFKTTAPVVDAGGFRTVAVTPITPGGSDGTLANEPVAVEWRLAGADKDVDAYATDEPGLAAYDAEDTGFLVMVHDIGVVGDLISAKYRKQSLAAGDWLEVARYTGPKGETGLTGPIGVNWRGAYDGGTEYSLRDGVSNLGSSWRYINAVPSTGNAPPALPAESNAHWTLVARKGNDGAGTVAGIVEGTGIAVDTTDPTLPVVALANMPAGARVKGRAVGAGAGAPVDLTGAQVTAIIDTVVGDSGAGGTKGLVPAPAAGDAAAGRYLKADGTWQDPAPGRWITLADITINNQATVDITGIPADAKVLEIYCEGITPVTDAQNLEFLTSPDGGGSYSSAPGDYDYTQIRSTVGGSIIEAGGDAQSEIVVTPGIGNVSGEKATGTVTVHNPGANRQTTLTYQFWGVDANGAAFTTAGGGRRTAAEPTTALRLQFTSDSLSTGNVVARFFR